MKCSKNFLLPVATVLIALMIGSCTIDLLGSKSSTTPCGNTGNGYFYISHPYSGYSAKIGSYDSISWTSGSTSSISNVAIYLYDDQNRVSTVTGSYLNTGKYSWYVPSLGTGTKYRIKICSTLDTSKYDFGCNFSLYSPYNGTISVRKPDSTTRVVIDSSLQVSWTATGSPGSTVNLQLYKDTTYVSSISGSVSLGLGVYTWTSVTASSGSASDYRVKVTSNYNQSIYGFSAPFTILSQYNGSFTITTPSAATTWSGGSLYTIEWQTSGNVGSYIGVRVYNDSSLVYTLTSSSSNTGSYDWSIPAYIASGSKYRVKISSYRDPGIFAFSPLFTISGLSPDAYEPDNKRDSASTITATGAAQSHTLTLNDTDWVKFSADSGKSYLIQTSGVSSPYVYLFYDTVKSSSAYSTSTSPWMWACAKSGTWFVRIYSYYSGAYTFKVTKYDSSTALTFLNPTSTSTFSAGSTYQVQWSGDSTMFGSSVSLYLYKGNQLVQAISSGISNYGSYSWTVPSGVSTGSDYHIKISSYYSSLVSAFSPAFTISGTTSDTFEFDNTRDSAKAIAVDGTLQARTLSLGDTDWVKFSVDSGSLYLVQTSGISSPRTYLYFGNETFYTSYLTTSSPQMWTSARKGTMYAKISSYYTGAYTFKVAKYDSSKTIAFTNPTATSTWSSGSSYQVQWTCDSLLFGSSIYLYLYKGNNLMQSYSSFSNSGSYSASIPSGLATGNDYRIRITSYTNSSISGSSPAFSISGIAPDAYEPDDSASKASAIPVTGAAQNRSLSRNDKDWISFSAEKDSLYIISATGDSGISLYVYLYSSPAASYLTSSYGAAPKLTWKCPLSGTYYLLVSPYSLYGNYGISVKKYSAVNLVTFINPTAQSTWSAGSLYSVQWLPDSALFGNYVRLQLTVDTVVVQSISTYGSNSGAYSFTPAAGLATGSAYRIKMTNYTTSTIVAYSPAFTISGLDPDAYEPDDTVSAAHAIAAAGKAENHTLTINDKDWFSFSASAGMLYLISATGAVRTMSTALTLYQTDGRTLLSSVSSTIADSSATIAWYCSAAGTYFFKITSLVTGAYSASVLGNDSTKFRFTVSAPPATGGAYGVGKTCSILWASQINVGGYVDIFLYDSSGVVETVVANASNSGAYTWTIPAAEAPGTHYYVKVISRVNSNIFGNSGVFSITAP